MEFRSYNWFAVLRWKLYRLSMLLTLGRVGGWGLYSKVIYRICDNFESVVLSHVKAMKLISTAFIEHFNYDNNYGEKLRPEACLPRRYLYHLKDVAVSPASGAMWIPNERILIESLGTNMEFWDLGGMVDVMCRPRRHHCSVPIVPCPNISYYHWLIIALPQLLIAKNYSRDGIKVLISNTPARYVASALEFLGFKEDSIIHSDYPLLVDDTILVARNIDAGVAFRSDLEALRNAILPRLNIPKTRTRKLYISRRLEKNRAVVNEDLVEQAVITLGFEVCYFEKMAFGEQMQAIAEAAVVMGVHGAGLSNLIAGQPGLKVIEILNPDWFNACFAQLTQQLGFEYHSLLLRKTDHGLEVPIDEIEKYEKRLADTN